MRKILLPFFISSLLFIPAFSFGQTIHANTQGFNVACNHSKLGKAWVYIISPTNHAPYNYVWSTGVTHTGGGTIDSIEDLEVGTYTVSITDNQDSELGSAEVTIYLDDCVMAAESIFTPNEDGFNDTWIISNYEYFPDAWFLVFNRLGQKVHDQKGLYVPWEGRDMFGRNLPDAGYYYIIYPDKSDKKVIIKGCVNIVH